jgi:hypothetical protein
MNYYELIKKYATGKGEKAMWAATKRVSDFLEEVKEAHPEKYWALIKTTYEEMCGPHFDEAFGEWQIAQMYYKDAQGNEHRAPNWTADQYKMSYEQHRSRLRDSSYTCWDWAVTLEMCYTDNHVLLKRWFPSNTEEELKAKAAEMALVYLNDDDGEDGKIWRRYNK